MNSLIWYVYKTFVWLLLVYLYCVNDITFAEWVWTSQWYRGRDMMSESPEKREFIKLCCSRQGNKCIFNIDTYEARLCSRYSNLIRVEFDIPLIGDLYLSKPTCCLLFSFTLCYTILKLHP